MPRPGSPSTAAPHLGARSRLPPTPPSPRHLTPPHSSLPSRSTFPVRTPGSAKPPQCNTARTATTAAAPPNRTRPLPHASLFPGGLRQRAPQGGAGNWNPRNQIAPHSPATPHKRTKRSRSAMVGARPWAVTEGRRLSPRVSVTRCLRAPDWLAAAAPRTPVPPHPRLAGETRHFR